MEKQDKHEKHEKEEKPVKMTNERIQESMSILQKLKDMGVSSNDPSYKQLSSHFNTWIKGGDSWVGTVDFYRYNRRAKVILPTKPGTVAKCDFLHHVF